MLRWEAVDLQAGTAKVRGTKSKSSRRQVNLPVWLTERLQAYAEARGTDGLVLSSPAHLAEPERVWDQSNSNAAVRAVLDSAGFGWALPHTFRRTVATMLHEQGAPLVRIADTLGHRDAAMTARTYLGRDFEGDKSDLAALL